MSDRFSNLLHDLSKVFGLSLQVDKHHSCSIYLKPITIQMQLDSIQENLFLFCKVIELPPGKFRENVLMEALKANGQADPRPGIFGYIAASNHLALHQKYPLMILTGDRLANLFGAFFETAESWHQAIQRGQPGPLIRGAPSPFGL